MSEFDYANTRLRAMKSRLLPRQRLEELTQAGSLPALLTALGNTAYREPVLAAFARTSTSMGLQSLAEALRDDIITTIGCVHEFFPEGSLARQLATLLLRRYDVHNLKTVLRGLARQVPPDQILAATLPVGELGPSDLKQLVHTANIHHVVDLLATWRASLARPWLEARSAGQAQGGELAEMETALERWHFQTALAMASQGGQTGAILFEALQLQADAANILTALRLVGATSRPDEIRDLFVGPGRIPLARLEAAASHGSVAAALDEFAPTPYQARLTKALAQYESSPRLSAFERALARHELLFAASLFVRDPLGLGVLIGYVALKTNEIANLRAIAHGLWLEEVSEGIRAQLLFVD
jgi:V/A-type H+-transporting ATPase subunit C